MSNDNTDEKYEGLERTLRFRESTLQAQIMKHIICTLFPMVQGGCVAYTITDMIRRPTTKSPSKYLAMEWVGLFFICIGWILNTLLINNSLTRSGRRHQASMAVIIGQECPKSAKIDPDNGTWPNCLPENNSSLPAIPWALYGIGLALEQSNLSLPRHKTPPSLEASVIELVANLFLLAYWRKYVRKSKKRANPFIKEEEVQSNDYVGPADGYEAPDSSGYQAPAFGPNGVNRMQPTMPHTLPPNAAGNVEMNFAEMPSVGPPLEDNSIEYNAEVHNYEDNTYQTPHENRVNQEQGRIAEMPELGPPSEEKYKWIYTNHSEQEQSGYQ